MGHSVEMSALGQKQTYAVHQPMSALPPKRPRKRISAQGHVCFTPESGHVQCNEGCPLWAKSGHAHLFDHLVRTRLQCRRHAQAERLGGLEVDVQLNLCCPLYRQLGGLVAPENPAGIDAS